MELWIRSQDKKNLVKIRQISLNYQNNKQIIANYTPELYENSGGYYELLGTYKTKERALDVLTEIQNKINLINLGHDFGSPMIDLKNPTYIYQMPEN